MLIRFTSPAGGHRVGQIADAPSGQAEALIARGVAIPVEQGPDGRITITKSGRKIPRRDRSATAINQAETVD